MSEQTPSIGRVVHFVFGDRHVPAIITAAAYATDVHGVPMDMLTVFPPGEHPFYDLTGHSEQHLPGTWHWPEYVPAAS